MSTIHWTGQSALQAYSPESRFSRRRLDSTAANMDREVRHLYTTQRHRSHGSVSKSSQTIRRRPNGMRRLDGNV